MSIWPVLLRVGSLPKAIRNRNSGYAGNTVIALLPKIERPASEENNPNWPIFMRTVFHTAMKIILACYVTASKIGYQMRCGDYQIRTLVPWFPIISQDLEEAWLSALNRGLNALYPCPRCMVPQSEQGNLLQNWDLRNQEMSQAIYREAMRLWEAGEARKSEDLLKFNGLYLVENAWWSISRADVHQALSFDILHTLWLGIWGKHMWPMLLRLMAAEMLQSLDQRAGMIPSYPGLRRFPGGIAHIDFTDGRTYFSILQQILPIAYDLIHAKFHPFLRLIRLLAKINMHVLFKMQTPSRISTGKALIQQFGQELQTVRNILPTENWNYPKLHQLLHIFPDIQAKGAADNFSCMLGEGFHQGLIKSYEQSNKKKASEQVLRMENWILAVSRIRWRINEGEEKEVVIESPETTMDGTADSALSARLGSSEQRLVPVQEIEHNGGYFTGFKSLAAFNGFMEDLCKFLRDYARSQDWWQDSMDSHSITATTQIRIFKLIYHSYPSMDTGFPSNDYIRCNPSAYGQLRFDTVIVQTEIGFAYARLLLVFQVKAFDRQWQLARVTYFQPTSASIDSVIGQNRIAEQDHGDFIFLGSIVRSCHILPAFHGGEREFYVNDLAAGDTDLYLRLNPMEDGL